MLSLLSSVPTLAADCNPEVFQDEIDKFALSDEKKPADPGGVVFVGSSSIRMWDLEESFPGNDYLNRGFGGSQICQSTYFFDQLVGKHSPQVVVFYAGDNDIAGGKSPKQVHDDFVAFAMKITDNLPETKLVYISIKPSIARWKLADRMREANNLIEAECKKHENFEFVDVWPVMLNDKGEPREDIFLEDGLHMNKKGYELWTELIKPTLEQSANQHK